MSTASTHLGGGRPLNRSSVAASFGNQSLHFLDDLLRSCVGLPYDAFELFAGTICDFEAQLLRFGAECRIFRGALRWDIGRQNERPSKLDAENQEVQPCLSSSPLMNSKMDGTSGEPSILSGSELNKIRTFLFSIR